jgi:photosystem II stability/assembly factor-like uncharacterized protein
MIALALVAVLLCACGSDGSAPSITSPTPTPEPPATPSATGSPTATPVPSATPVPTAELVGRWTATGPDGGPVTVLAPDPRQPHVLYAGTPGGVFKSVDAGATWSSRSDGIRDQRGLLPRDGILALAVDSSDTEVVYAGTRERVWKTLDGGTSWRALAVDAGQVIAIDPSSTATVYAASAEIRKSVDGGSTWRKLPFTFGGPVRTIAVHPYRKDTVLVGTLYAGVLVSHDGGETWLGPSPNFPEAVHGFAFDPREPEVVYAGAQRGGVYRSPDAGVTWRAWFEGLPGEFFASTAALASDPGEAGTLYVIAEGNLYARSDSDASWTRIGSSPLDLEIGALLVASQRTVYAATVGGLFRSVAEDRSWRRIGTGIRSSRVLTLAIDPVNPEAVLAGTDGGVRCSADSGRTWTSCPSEALSNAMVGGIAFDPANPSRVLASACGIFVSADGGRSWVQTLGPSLDRDCRRVDYGTRIDPARFAIDPSNPDRVFAALGDLYRSEDGGGSWIHVLVSLGDGVQCHGFRGVAIDPVDSSVVYAVDGIGGPARSEDGGASFPPVSCGLLPLGEFAAIAIDPRSPATVYASLGRGLVKSIDGGETWRAVRGIDSVWTLMFDPVDPTTLYAGTDSGVFVTVDGGSTWGPLNDGLLVAPVYELAIDPRDGRTLLAGTDGGSVQRMRLESRP